MNSKKKEIIHDRLNKMFTLELDDSSIAKVVYTIDSCGGMRLIHSEVPASYRGGGIGKELVLKTFEKLTEEGYVATAVCGYIKVMAMRDAKWNTIINH